MTFDITQLWLSLPLLIVSGGGILLLLVEAFTAKKEGGARAFLMPLTLAILAAAMVVTALLWVEAGPGAGSRSLFSGMLSCDRYSLFFTGLFLASAALTAMLLPAYMQEHRFEFGEVYALVLFAVSGMIILAQAVDLVSIFLGVETMSLAVYVLTGCWRRQPRSSEAALKYFLTGAFATALLLYGTAMVYGISGSTSLAVIGREAQRLAGQPVFLIGMLLLLVALAFKVGAVPFHMWAPDAYDGAPTVVTGFMASAVKAAAFATMLRMFDIGFHRVGYAHDYTLWAWLLSGLAAATMVVGNLMAIKQSSVKRMLAYSSIAHAGYLLIGVIATSIDAADVQARSAILYYLAAYTFTTVGAFGVVAWIGSKDEERLELDDWAGLASRHPGAALLMTIFLLSLAGVPPTAGFFGKFYLFRVAVDQPKLIPLVVLAVMNSVASAYYYLRIVMTMYFREVGREPKPIQSTATNAAILLAAIATLFFGILPTGLLNAASSALFGG